jgi:hypothetical protein
LRRKKAENLRRRKETLFKKVYKLGKYDGVDVAGDVKLMQDLKLASYNSTSVSHKYGANIKS